MGYYNPIYIYGVDQLPRRREGRRRRRPDRRRPAAGGGRGALPAGAQGRARTSSASRRRPPTTSGCRRCSRTRRASSITSRSPASPARPRPTPARSRAAVARIKRHTKLPVAVGFGVRTAEQARAIARRRRRRGGRLGAGRRACSDSLDKDGKATRQTVEAVTELVAALAARRARALASRPRNSHIGMP